MAEIRVEPRKRSMAWLWLILLIAVIAVAVWYFMYNGQNVAPVGSTSSLAVPAPPVPTLIS